ncbi:hypothetical protein [Caballeronia arationis]|uniref:hypothetical protein n=1 Tax=Caballeronia arationis TaxID=1777142 RepID=UPI0011981E45|nr:hypothetical protein [Caballeronia arationis]
MLLELAHGRQVFGELEAYFGSVRKVWEAEKLGQLVALEKIRLMLMQEKTRQGALAGLPPPPDRNEPDDPEPALID